MEGLVPTLLKKVLDMDEVKLKKFISVISVEKPSDTAQLPKMDPYKIRSLFRAQRKQKEPYFYDQDFSYYRFSKTPLKKLQLVRIQDLQVGKRAEGSYLLLRVLEPPIECAGVTTVVEDHTGDVCIFTLSLYIHVDSNRPVEEEVAVGTVFAVKEPVLKIAAKNSLVVFSSSSADSIKINRNHFLWDFTKQISWKHHTKAEPAQYPDGLSDMEMKVLGNQFYKTGKYMEAIEIYSITLTNCKDMALKKVFHLNLSAAYLATEQYELALKHAIMVLDIEARNMKGLLRSGHAYYQLRQYLQAKKRYQKFLKLDPSNMDVALKIEQCIERLNEESGNIDMKKLCLNVMSKPSTPIDCGDHVGPVELVPIKSKGRGVIASRDLPPGTLLTVSKAYQIQYNSTDQPLQRQGVLDLSKLFHTTVQTIFKNPNHFGKLFYQLSSNDSEMDKRYQLFCDEESEEEPIIDLLRIILNIRVNTFVFSSIIHFEIPPAFLPIRKFTSALFGFPSYFNHSCVSNSNYKVYNDVIVIRTNTSVRKGEELTICYLSGVDGYIVGNEGYLNRKGFLSRRGFQCWCELCRLDNLEPLEIHKKRESNIIELKSLLPSERTPENITRLMKSMELSYGLRKKLRVQLADYYMALAFNGYVPDTTHVMENVNKALNCFGLSCEILLKLSEDDSVQLPNDSVICYDYLTVMIIFPVLIAWFQAKNTRQRQKWVKVLCMVERVLLGGDVNTLKVKTKANFLYSHFLQ